MKKDCNPKFQKLIFCPCAERCGYDSYQTSTYGLLYKWGGVTDISCVFLTNYLDRGGHFIPY